jgi:hypothetical protein
VTFQLPSRKNDLLHIIRLDPPAIFLMLYALFSFIAVIVFTNTPIVIFGPSTDLGTIAANYLLITAPVAAFAPLLVGSYIYDPRELGPILRPVVWGKGFKRESFPDVAIIGIFVTLLAVVGVDYVFTYGGFSPTLSFWNTLTNKIVYSDGGIFEEFIFRAVFYGALNRFPGVGKYLLGNWFVFLGVTAPANVAAFLIYHLKVYATSTLALTLVAAEAYLINVTYKGLKYCLWAVMVIHAVINWTSSP